MLHALLHGPHNALLSLFVLAPAALYFLSHMALIVFLQRTFTRTIPSKLALASQDGIALLVGFLLFIFKNFLPYNAYEVASNAQERLALRLSVPSEGFGLIFSLSLTLLVIALHTLVQAVGMLQERPFIRMFALRSGATIISSGIAAGWLWLMAHLVII
jgi:hypothetical protein